MVYFKTLRGYKIELKYKNSIRFTSNMNSNTVIIYCRLSRTPNGDRGIISLDSQEYAINIYISKNGWKVYSVLKNIGSAYRGEQNEIKQMLRSCKGKTLTVYEANRLSRNLENFDKIWKICQRNKHNIAIANIERVFEPGNHTDYLDLKELIRIAEKESRDMGERISRTFQMKKAQEIPYGKTKDNFGNIIDYKTEQDIINLIKLLNTTGSSIKVITDTIYSCGKTEGKERFELVEYEYKRGCNEFDVEGQLLPFPMSPTGIKETLDYYEIKHRNRKWTTADIKTYM